MLPSCGYFKNIVCPFFASGFCERPHCHFRHERRGTDVPSRTLPQNVLSSTLPDRSSSTGNKLIQLYDEAIRKIQQEVATCETKSIRVKETPPVHQHVCAVPVPTYIPTPVNRIKCPPPKEPASVFPKYTPTPIAQLKRLRTNAPGADEEYDLTSKVSVLPLAKKRKVEEYDPTKVTPISSSLKQVNSKKEEYVPEVPSMNDDASHFSDQSDDFAEDTGAAFSEDSDSETKSNEENSWDSVNGKCIEKFDVVNQILEASKKSDEFIKGFSNVTQEVKEKSTKPVVKTKLEESKAKTTSSTAKKTSLQKSNSVDKCITLKNDEVTLTDSSVKEAVQNKSTGTVEKSEINTEGGETSELKTKSLETRKKTSPKRDAAIEKNVNKGEIEEKSKLKTKSSEIHKKSSPKRHESVEKTVSKGETEETCEQKAKSSETHKKSSPKRHESLEKTVSKGETEETCEQKAKSSETHKKSSPKRHESVEKNVRETEEPCELKTKSETSKKTSPKRHSSVDKNVSKEETETSKLKIKSSETSKKASLKGHASVDKTSGINNLVNESEPCELKTKSSEVQKKSPKRHEERSVSNDLKTKTSDSSKKESSKNDESVEKSANKKTEEKGNVKTKGSNSSSKKTSSKHSSSKKKSSDSGSDVKTKTKDPSVKKSSEKKSDHSGEKSKSSSSSKKEGQKKDSRDGKVSSKDKNKDKHSKSPTKIKKDEKTSKIKKDDEVNLSNKKHKSSKYEKHSSNSTKSTKHEKSGSSSSKKRESSKNSKENKEYKKINGKSHSNKSKSSKKDEKKKSSSKKRNHSKSSDAASDAEDHHRYVIENGMKRRKLSFLDDISESTNFMQDFKTSNKSDDFFFTKEEESYLSESEIMLISGDTDFDDHDTMEECRRIFNEFPGTHIDSSDKQKMHKFEEIFDAHQNSLIPNKKRVAHQPNLERNTVTLPPQTRISPAQAMHNRLLLLQQRYSQEQVKKLPSFVTKQLSEKDNKRIAPVPNVALLIALARQRLNAQKEDPHAPEITVAATVPKGARRIAHVPIVVKNARPSIPSEYGSKVPSVVRQRYLNLFIDECLKFCRTEEAAYDRGLAEEKNAYERSTNKTVYLNVAVNTLKRLRDLAEKGPIEEEPEIEVPLPASPPEKRKKIPIPQKVVLPKTISHEFVLGGAKAARTSFSIERKISKPTFDDCLRGEKLYTLLKPYILTEEQLDNNGFPKTNPNEPGKALFKKMDGKKGISSDPFQRVCCRCQTSYRVDVKSWPIKDEECMYHWGKLWKQRMGGRGNFDRRYNCCQGDADSDGCCVGKGHVHEEYDYEKLKGFVKTLPKLSVQDASSGVFALDCEMCYTTQGIELTRVTVIGDDLKPVYEAMVKPENPVIDYNTRFSGICEDDLIGVRTTIRDVQAVLLSMFNEKTILMGHSLESDFRALRLIHGTVVDTSVVFPHKMGAPYKRALRNLMAEYLNKIIQNNVEGHDSQEDALACMQLMLWKVKDDLKIGR